MWMNIVATLLGGGLRDILSEMRKARKDALDAQNDEHLIAARERVDTLEIEWNAQVQLAQYSMTQVGKLLFAIPFILYVNKVVLWDKVIMSNWAGGSTDPLGEDMTALLWIVVGGYYLIRGIKKFKDR